MDYTQEQVSKLLNKKILAIKRYESGAANIPLDVADALNKHKEIVEHCELETKILADAKQYYKLWKLTPINLDAPEWETSIRKSSEPIVIPALDEGLARMRAHLLYGIAAARRPNGDIMTAAWTNPSVVTCEIVSDQETD